MFFDRREQAERKRLRAEEEKESENRTQDKANKSRNGTKVDPCRRFRVVSIRFWQMQKREKKKKLEEEEKEEEKREEKNGTERQFDLPKFPAPRNGRENGSEVQKTPDTEASDLAESYPRPLYFKVETRSLATLLDGRRLGF